MRDFRVRSLKSLSGWHSWFDPDELRMAYCLFASDLHGKRDRYDKLFASVLDTKPEIVFLGGDLLPNFAQGGNYPDFFQEVIAGGLQSLKDRLGAAYPRVFAILGNDDPRVEERGMRMLEFAELCHYIHNRRMEAAGHSVYGYGIIPPSPFRNKDWEKYDVSRYVPPGAVSPEEGFRTVPVDSREIRYSTIAKDLEALTGEVDLTDAVLLAHSPPHETTLDRVAADGKMIDHVPLDLNVGSIALRRLIESRQPLLTLHGHIHESARLTGEWRDRIGRTHLFSAAHDGPELALVIFDTADLESAERLLL